MGAVDPDGKAVLWDLADVGFAVHSIAVLWHKALSGQQITAEDNFNAIADAIALAPIVPSLGVAREGFKGAKRVVEAAEGARTAERAADAAHNAAEGLRLQKSLASEAQVAEVEAGKAKAIAGPGAEERLRDASRLAEQYGGRPEEWTKVSSKSFSAKDGTHIQVHGYRNVNNGKVVELKTKVKDLEGLPDRIGGSQ